MNQISRIEIILMTDDSEMKIYELFYISFASVNKLN